MKTNTAVICAAALSVAGLTGCVSVEHIPMTAATADSMKGREISLSERPKPDFGAMTAGRMAGGALFGAIGGAVAGSAMVSAGNEIVAQNNLEDPAQHIGVALTGALGARFGAKLNAPRTQISTDDAAEVAKSAAGSDLVLDVRTINWGFVYFPTSWSKYRVMYTARTRLIDAKKGQVVAEAGCAAPVADNADAAPTYEEMLADGAARLKKELAHAAEFCAGEFASKMFSLDLAQYRSATPAIAAAPAPAKTELAKTALPVPVAAAEPVKGMPSAGTLWKYRFEDRKFSSRNRSFSVQLAGAAGSSVTETFASSGNQQTYTSNSQAIDFLVRTIDSEPVYELAPYLLAHMPAPSAPPVHRPAYVASGTLSPDWQVRIAEVRREPVQVPAGRFEAVRLRITGEYPGGLHSTHSAHAVNAAATDYRTQRFEYTIWYVPEIGRYVQSRHQTFNRYGNEIGDEWVQLSSVERPAAR